MPIFPSSVTPAIASQSLESSHIYKTSDSIFYGADCLATSVDGYLMLFDAATVPADGAVTPIKCWPVASGTSIATGSNPPIQCANGIVLVFSTTGPFTKTSSATAYISAQVSN